MNRHRSLIQSAGVPPASARGILPCGICSVPSSRLRVFVVQPHPRNSDKTQTKCRQKFKCDFSNHSPSTTYNFSAVTCLNFMNPNLEILNLGGANSVEPQTSVLRFVKILQPPKSMTLEYAMTVDCSPFFLGLRPATAGSPRTESASVRVRDRLVSGRARLALRGFVIPGGTVL